MPATAAAFAIAMTFHFVANKLFTFEAEGNTSRQVGKYLIASLATYTITVLIIEVAKNRFGLSNLLAVLASASVTLVVGYVLGRFWVYR